MALLKAHWAALREYIDNFIPFVAECLRIAPADLVAIPELQRAVFEQFGMQVPQGALTTKKCLPVAR